MSNQIVEDNGLFWRHLVMWCRVTQCYYWNVNYISSTGFTIRLFSKRTENVNIYKNVMHESVVTMPIMSPLNNQELDLCSMQNWTSLNTQHCKDFLVFFQSLWNPSSCFVLKLPWPFGLEIKRTKHLYEPCHEKTWHAICEQRRRRSALHPHSLISIFIVPSLDSIISVLAISKYLKF